MSKLDAVMRPTTVGNISLSEVKIIACSCSLSGLRDVFQVLQYSCLFFFFRFIGSKVVILVTISKINTVHLLCFLLCFLHSHCFYCFFYNRCTEDSSWFLYHFFSWGVNCSWLLYKFFHRCWDVYSSRDFCFFFRGQLTNFGRREHIWVCNLESRLERRASCDFRLGKASFCRLLEGLPLGIG